MKIQKDKILHFSVNVVATIASVVLYCINPILLVPMLAVGLSLGKEYGDSKAKGNYWSWGDIVADFLGIAVVVVIALTISLFV